MSSISAFPWLPVELIESIICETWNLELTTDERVNVMTSFVLVNKTWNHLFMRTSSRDVHIPTPSFLQQHLRILQGESQIYDNASKHTPDAICRSITIMVDRDPLTPGEGDSPMGKTLSDLLYSHATIPYAPNLKKIVVKFQNTSYNDIFDHYRFIAFPTQVTDLEISFIPSSGARPDSYREREGCLPWSLPSIKRLSVLGGCLPLTADMVSACPNIETLIMDPLAEIQMGNDSSSCHASISIDREGGKPPRPVMKLELKMQTDGDLTSEFWQGEKCGDYTLLQRQVT